MENKTLLPLALTYLDRGWSVIICGKDKIPILPWKTYQERLATPEEIAQWFTDYPDAQIGIVCGLISNLTVADRESDADSNLIQDQTYKVRTGGGGTHDYFQYEKDFKNAVKIFPSVDIRSEGGYVVAAGSHSFKGEYTELNNLPVAKMSDLTRNLFLNAREKDEEKANWKESFVKPLEQGERNDSFASIIGGLLKRFPMDEWESLVWPTVVDKNTLQEKPLSPTELRTTYESICKAEMQARHQGGDIKDISVEVIEDDMKVNIRLEQCIACFKIKNIISSLAEAGVITWIEKPAGLTPEIRFYLKIHSDTNKEQWVRILSKAFDRKENKETYPWTIIVAKVVSAIENHIKNRQQCFAADTIEAKECTWLLEPFIQEDMINTIFGMGSSGKTLLALYFSKEIAQLLGHNVLFIDYEDTSGGWKNKLAKITGLNDFTVDLNKFFYFDSEQIPIAEQVDKIKDEIKKHDIKLVVVDSASLATGESTSDEKSAVRLVSALKLLKTTVLLIAHQRKNDGDRTPIGSIQYENQSRNVWNIKGVPDDNDSRIIHIACTHTKANNTWLRRNPLGLVVEYADDYIRISEENAYEYFQEKYSVIQNIEKLLKDEGELGYKEIATSIGITPASANKNLTTGKKRKLFENKDGKWSIKKPP